MKKILIIEDNTRIANTISDVLVQQGYSAKVAYTGEEGVKYYKQMKFDLIVLDLSLPEKDGMTILEEIRMLSIVPVIVLSDKDSKVSVASILGAGADDYLTKPFYSNELLARIEVLLGI
jgi:DNA-binding response OmpR family regulator